MQSCISTSTVLIIVLTLLLDALLALGAYSYRQKNPFKQTTENALQGDSLKQIIAIIIILVSIFGLLGALGLPPAICSPY